MMWVLLFMSLVAIFNTEKLIPSKKTHQTSHYTDGVDYTSHRAVDGDLSTSAHTLKEKNSWWNIDLLGLYEISSITIYNFQHHNIIMNGCQIHIGNISETNGTANSKCTTITNFTLGKNNTFKCDSGPMLGQYVTIYSKEDWFLILCEVWIYGTSKGLVLIKENKTWEDALSYCRAQNMHLAFIADNKTQEWAMFEATESNSPFVWLGLHYSCTLEFWFWVNDHDLGYTYWAPGNKTDECDMSVAMYTAGDHQWYSKPDNETFNFLCTK